jgi:hypothetical protein
MKSLLQYPTIPYRHNVSFIHAFQEPNAIIIWTLQFFLTVTLFLFLQNRKLASIHYILIRLILLHQFSNTSYHNIYGPRERKQTLWPQSASVLYLPSDRRFSAKFVPTWVRWCRVVRATDPHGRIIRYLDLDQEKAKNKLRPFLYINKPTNLVTENIWSCCPPGGD